MIDDEYHSNKAYIKAGDKVDANQAEIEAQHAKVISHIKDLSRHKNQEEI